MITQEKLRNLLHYCPDTGLFTRLISIVGIRRVGSIAGSVTHDGYITIGVDRSSYMAHRLAWFYTHGEWPNQIDHISGLKTDNRIINLRSVSSSENMKNKKIGSNNSSGVIGVSWVKARSMWKARISINGVNACLGLSVYKWDAICARKSAERIHGYHDNHGRIC